MATTYEIARRNLWVMLAAAKNLPFGKSDFVSNTSLNESFGVLVCHFDGVVVGYFGSFLTLCYFIANNHHLVQEMRRCQSSWSCQSKTG